MQGQKGLRHLLLIIVCFTLLLQLVVVRNFFIRADPIYLGAFPQWPIPLFAKRFIFLVLLSGLAVLSFLKSSIRKPVFLLLLLCTLAIAANNLCFMQIWLFLHFSFLFALVFAGTDEEALWCIRAMTIAMYVFSGISKVNVHYASHFFPYFFGRHLPLEQALAYGTALLEILLALGLLNSRTNRLCKFGLMALHIWLLSALRNNQVVYPWNAEMALLVLIAFPREAGIFRIPSKSIVVLYTLGFFLVHPIVQQTGRGLFSLGFNMYYFAQPRGYVLLSSEAASLLPGPFKGYSVPGESRRQFSIDAWVFRQYKVPVAAADRIYKNAMLHFCNHVSGAELQLKIVKRKRFGHDPDVEYLSCTAIQNR